MKWLTLIRKTEREKYVKRVSNISVGKTQSVFYRLVGKDGDSIKWVEDKVSLVQKDENSFWVCGNLTFIKVDPTLKFKNLIVKEAELIDHINRSAINGVDSKELTLLMLKSLAQITGVQSNRFYMYSKSKNALRLDAEMTGNVPVTFIENRFSINIKQFAPSLDGENNPYAEAFRTNKPIISSEPDVIKEMIELHTQNRALKMAANWVRTMLKMKTYGIIPIVINNSPFGLITFTTPDLLKEEQIKSIYRFWSYLSFALSKTKMEEQNKKLINDLSKRVAQQTEYNYVVSHHLRAPVATLLGLVNILNKAEDEDEKKLIINYINSSAQEMDRVLHELSEILNLKSSESLTPEEYSLPELMEVIENNFNEEVKSINGSIHLNIEKKLRKQIMFGYKLYVENIMRTAILNCIKYRIKERALEVQISAQHKEDVVEITIKDNGSGIDLKKHQENLFGVYKSFHPEVPGKGLALHISKTQAEKMGGTISIESKLNEGTTFRLVLPVSLHQE